MRSRHGFASEAFRLELRTLSFGTASRGVDAFLTVVPKVEGLGTILKKAEAAMDRDGGAAGGNYDLEKSLELAMDL
jgi:hypothetical protein